MQTKPPNNILLITGPGYTAWNQKYTNDLIATFNNATVYPVGNGVGNIPLSSMRSMANTYAFARGPKIIFATLHGGRNDDLTHHVAIEKGSVISTRSIFAILKHWSTSPLFIFLASCHGGACEQDVETLPEGSAVFTTASKSSAGYTFDGPVLAQALNRFLTDGVPIEYIMYLMAYSYLASHAQFSGNHPCLIVKGHGELLTPHFKLSIANNPSTPLPSSNDLIKALRSSCYSDFLKNLLQVLLKKSESNRVCSTNKNILQRVADHLKSEYSTPFQIDYRLEYEVSTLLKTSAALLLIATDEQEAITIANTHRIVNSSLLCETIRTGLNNLALHLLGLGIDCANLTINNSPIIFFATEHPDLLRSLIKANARLHVVLQGSGSTPLHRANFACSEILLAAGANQNQVDNDGYTPLHTCIAQNDLARLILLYKHPKTDRSIVTPDAKSYSEYAESLNRSEIVEFLDSLNKKRKERDKNEPDDANKELLKIRIRLDTKLGKISNGRN